MNDGWFDRGNREHLLSSKTGVKKPSQGFARVLDELFERRRRGDDDGRNDALQMACRAGNETAEFSWSKVGDMADDEILNKLCKPEVLEHIERQGGTRRGRLRVKGDVRDGV